MERYKKLLTSAFFICCALLIFRTIFLLWNNFLPDFSVFYYSAELISRGENPYLSDQLYTQVNYLPAAIVLFYPFLFLSFHTASNIWLVLSILLFLSSIAILYRIYPVNSVFLSASVLLAAISFPFKFTLGMGQINLVVFFLLVLFIYFLKSNSNVLSGATLAVATIIKVFPGILILYPIVKRDWKNIGVYILVLILLAVFSLTVVGVRINLYYLFDVLLPLLSQTGGEVYYNQSITGVFGRLHLPISGYIITRIVIWLWVIYILTKIKNNVFHSVGLIVVTILMTNVFTWQHHLILLFIPYYFLISAKGIKKAEVFIVFFSYVLVAFNIRDTTIFRDSVPGNIILSHGFFGIFILWLVYCKHNLFTNNE